MHSPEFIEALQRSGAVVAESEDNCFTVTRFENIEDELKAAASTCVVCPMPDLIRIRATGTDRAKFLHNFCTNDILSLNDGQACEAFFTDVKAKVLAHGMVLATPDNHEIWMLPGNRDSLVAHLNRYIITEDVAIESAEQQAAFAVIGPNTLPILQAVGVPATVVTNGCAVEADLNSLTLTWADTPVAIVSVPASAAPDIWKQLTDAGAKPSGHHIFDHFRIVEGFPLIGVDITDQHIAPEGGRNQQTICYTKGCYLGQEPIARVDAIGHVNRQLFKGTANKAVTANEDENTFIPTSMSQVVQEQVPVLVVVPVKSVAASQPIKGTTADGHAVEISIKHT